MPKRKRTRKITARVYRLGARAPLEGAALLEQQLYRASQYRNALVEMERRRRAGYHALLKAHCPRLLELEEQEADLLSSVERIKEEVGTANSQARQRRATSSEALALKEAKAALKACRAELKTMRTACHADPVIAPLLRENWVSVYGTGKTDKLTGKPLPKDQQCKGEMHRLRANCGAYWGTYLLVEAAAEGMSKGSPPVFRRHTGEGRIGVQFQGGLSVREALAGTDDRFRLVRADWRTGTKRRTPGSRRDRLPGDHVAWLRAGAQTEPVTIASRKGRAKTRTIMRPVWVKVPVVLHRELPKEGTIKWAILTVRRVACQMRYHLNIVVELPEGANSNEPTGDGAVGLDIGWRLMPCGGRRVATWRDEQGHGGELILSADHVADLGARHEVIAGARQERFDEAKSRLKQWLADCLPGEVPAWLAEATRTLHAWRSPARLAALVLRWRDGRECPFHPERRAARGQDVGRAPAWLQQAGRFAGDEDMLAALENWRRTDRRDYEEQANLRERAIARRLDIYRQLAAKLRTEHGRVFIEDVNWVQLARRREACDNRPAAAPGARFLVAPGLLAQVLVQGCGALKVPAAYTSCTCSTCGVVNTLTPEVWFVCAGCGREWDRDDNAARNILARGLALHGPAPVRTNASGEVEDKTPGGAREAQPFDRREVA